MINPGKFRYGHYPNEISKATKLTNSMCIIEPAKDHSEVTFAKSLFATKNNRSKDVRDIRELKWEKKTGEPKKYVSYSYMRQRGAKQELERLYEQRGLPWVRNSFENMKCQLIKEKKTYTTDELQDESNVQELMKGGSYLTEHMIKV